MMGRIIDGKYRLLRLLGEGGMGSVYEAEPIQGGSKAGAAALEGNEPAPGVEPHVALKLLQPEVLDRGDSARLARFHREARAASSIDAEHIVRVLDFGTDQAMDAPYMVMELLRGEDLEQLLARVGSLPADTVLRIAAQVCLALDKAHRARVIHRDIKPANLFLARRAAGDVVVKILDFGLAKIKPGPGELTSGLTRSGGLLGSPRYMSPEQAMDSRSTDFKTDLWSLGMVLYHALSGNPPHHETVSLGALILALCASPPRLVPELVPGVPPEAVSVVHSALELDPARRFPSATAMLDAIRPLLPGGWSLDEGMLAPPGRASWKQGVHEARSLVPAVRAAGSGPVDAHAKTEFAEPSASRTRADGRG
jgi:serine/threonine-protein kinase